MCYPKPGPRCSAHALEALNKATLESENNPTPKKLDKAKQAQEDYDATPGGQNALSAQIALLKSSHSMYIDDKSTEIDILKHRLEQGVRKRQEALRAYRRENPTPPRELPPSTPIIVEKSLLKDPYEQEVDLSQVGIRISSDRSVSKNDLRKTLACVFSCREEEVSDELLTYAQAQGLDSSRAYVKENNDEGTFLSDASKRALADWYYSQNNAEDSEGILSYCRSKGTATSGLKPLEALKKQLHEENNPQLRPGVNLSPQILAQIRVRRNNKVDNATAIRKQRVRIQDIHIGNERHYEAISARPMESFGNSSVFAGVLYEDSQGRMSIVDGYHRLKGFREGNRQYANYIVLSGS